MQSKTFLVICLIFLVASPALAKPLFGFGSSSSNRNSDVSNLDSNGMPMGTTQRSKTRKVLTTALKGAAIGALAAGAYGLYKHGK